MKKPYTNGASDFILALSLAGDAARFRNVDSGIGV
jgi:hypothetical protein